MSTVPAHAIPRSSAPPGTASPHPTQPAPVAQAVPRPTPLATLHRELGARLVVFADWLLPLHYPNGIRAEHLHCRAAAALFDVSHMGQLTVGGGAAVRRELEALLPTDLATLAPGHCRYSLLLDAQGGILDDLIISAHDSHYSLVTNAARSAFDFAHIRAALPAGVTVELRADRVLLALQGPAAAAVLAEFLPGSAALCFMQHTELPFDGATLQVARLGYTGEDGFELSASPGVALALARRLLADSRVRAAGLGARDSLRLEAGLPLYGQDIDTTTSPVEAGLGFVVSPARRHRGDFPGAARISAELATGSARRRVGLRPEGRQPVRAGAQLLFEGRSVGHISSGGFGSSVGAPIAMGYVEVSLATPGQPLTAVAHGREHLLRVVAMPFTPHRYHRPPTGA